MSPGSQNWFDYDAATKAREAAEANRDAGMQLALDNAGDDWAARALAAVREYLENNKTLHADDFWAAGIVDEPANKKAIGPIFRKAAGEKWMRQTGDYKKSTSSNMLPKPVWQSLIYKGVV